MNNKEGYATTGTRMRVRVFAGGDFTTGEVDRWDFARADYTRGVPMGGDLQNAPEDGAPILMVRALRDPEGANLDRVEIVKGWVDAAGDTHEQISDAAWSDDREIGADGKLPPVGNTVDVADARFSNSIGETMLFAYWSDPDFDPAQRAFYYVQVLEIPTPRWITYDAKFFGVDLPEGVPTNIQERAYTSPIWYSPAR